MHITTPAPTHSGGAAPPAQMSRAPAADLALNEPNLDIRNGMVRVEALLDFEGLSQLEEQLQALKMLLKPRKAPPTPSAPAPQAEDERTMEDMLK